jgi:hypothetical protein
LSEIIKATALFVVGTNHRTHKFCWDGYCFDGFLRTFQEDCIASNNRIHVVSAGQIGSSCSIRVIIKPKAISFYRQELLSLFLKIHKYSCDSECFFKIILNKINDLEISKKINFLDLRKSHIITMR